MLILTITKTVLLTARHLFLFYILNFLNHKRIIMEKFCKKEFNFEELVYLTVWITVYVTKNFKQPKHKQNARCKKSQAVLIDVVNMQVKHSLLGMFL